MVVDVVVDVVVVVVGVVVVVVDVVVDVDVCGCKEAVISTCLLWAVENFLLIS